MKIFQKRIRKHGTFLKFYKCSDQNGKLKQENLGYIVLLVTKLFVAQFSHTIKVFKGSFWLFGCRLNELVLYFVFTTLFAVPIFSLFYLLWVFIQMYSPYKFMGPKMGRKFRPKAFFRPNFLIYCFSGELSSDPPGYEFRGQPEACELIFYLF